MIREWTPEAWQAYCTANPARRAKADRDRQLLQQLLDRAPRGRWLEAGCGYGRLSPLLAGAERLVVADRQPRMVQAVRQALRPAPSGVVADLTALPISPASFEVVICVGVLMHVARPLEALEQLAAAVKPGGVLIVSWNNGGSPWAWLLRAWARRPGALPQRFLRARQVCRRLQRLGFTIHDLQGDALIPLAAAYPGTERPLWPRWLWALRLERWGWGRWLLARWGYELFALARRQGETAC